VLAILASVVFLVQLFDETGFVSAIGGVEYQKLLPANEKKLAKAGRPGPTWNDVYAEFRARIDAHPSTRPHAAVAQLLRLVIDVNRGKMKPGDALAAAQDALHSDPNNLISRVAFAVLSDQAATSGGGPVRSAVQRLAAMRQIIEQPPQATSCMLYTQEFTDLWREIVKKYIRRPDVAANLAVRMDHYQITDQFHALPLIQELMLSLSKELRAAGKPVEADECVRWTVKMCLGLMRADDDAGSRLLCADLISRSVPEDSAAAEGMRRLRCTYHVGASEAPSDLTDSQRTPALSPELFRKKLTVLFSAVALAVVGVGAAGMFIIACGLTLLVSFFAAGSHISQSGAHEARGRSSSIRTLWDNGVLIAVGATMYVFAILFNVREYGLFSEGVLLVLAADGLLTGALIPVLVTSRSLGNDGLGSQIRLLALIFLATVCLLLPIVEPETIARVSRHLDEVFGMRSVLGASAAVIIVASLALSHFRLREMRRNAVLAWFGCMALAVILMALHNRTDAYYADIVAVGRADEIAARLGSDWKERYLKPALDAYDMAPSTTRPTP